MTDFQYLYFRLRTNFFLSTITDSAIHEKALMLLCQTAVCCPYVCNPHEIFAKNCNNFHGVNSIKLCISRVHRQKEKDFKFFLEVLFVIAHRFCCPCALPYIARKGMYARETLVGFPLHVKSPARRRPLLRSKSAAPKRKTPVGVSFFLEQGTGIEPASSAWEADVLPMY